MGHDHDHGEHGHSHSLAEDADGRYLRAALSLLVVFLISEAVIAWWANSVALATDAAHMVSDVAALGGSLWALNLAKRPPKDGWTYGWKRAEILSAAINGITLLVMGSVIAFEAIRRLIWPGESTGSVMMWTAGAGIVINIGAAQLLARANRTSLNVEGAYQHVLTDLYGFIATLIAGGVIAFTGWHRADAVASLIIVAIMLRAAWGLLRQSGRILLEGAPEHLDLVEIHTHLREVEHVIDVHDLHVWTVTADLPALSAHLVIEDECFTDGHAMTLLDHVQECLHGHFDVAHSTFQFEAASHAAHEVGHH